MINPSKLSNEMISSTGKRRRNSPQYLKEWWQAHPQRYLLAAAKQRAKKNNIEFDLQEKDIIIPETCPIRQVKLNPVHFCKHNKENSPCLDRIDNTKGYIKGNISVISFAANRLKSNLDRETLERLLKYVSSTN